MLQLETQLDLKLLLKFVPFEVAQLYRERVRKQFVPNKKLRDEIMSHTTNIFLYDVIGHMATTRLEARQNKRTTDRLKLSAIPQEIFYQMFLARLEEGIKIGVITSAHINAFKHEISQYVDESMFEAVADEFKGTELERYTFFPGMIDIVLEMLNS